MRDEILYYCRESVRAGLNFNTQGNISVRLSDEAIVITPSGVRYDLMTPEDLVVVDLDGNVLEGSMLPSTELPVHLAHYRRRPEVQAIVHTESTFVNVLGVLGRTIDPVLLNMVLYAKGPVPVMPFEFSTHAEFGRRSADLMGDTSTRSCGPTTGCWPSGPRSSSRSRWPSPSRRTPRCSTTRASPACRTCWSTTGSPCPRVPGCRSQPSVAATTSSTGTHSTVVTRPASRASASPCRYCIA